MPPWSRSSRKEWTRGGGGVTNGKVQTRALCKESVPWLGSEPPARKVTNGWVQSPCKENYLWEGPEPPSPCKESDWAGPESVARKGTRGRAQSPL
jgi:hypothetical protein